MTEQWEEPEEVCRQVRQEEGVSTHLPAPGVVGMEPRLAHSPASAQLWSCVSPLSGLFLTKTPSLVLSLGFFCLSLSNN